MKNGDLVVMPNAKDHLLRPDPSVGLIVDDKIVRSRIGVLWAGQTSVDYEPSNWLEVISEIP